jgi:hypothetical protein
VADRFGSWELAGGWEGAVRPLASASSVVAMAALGLWALALGRRFTGDRTTLHLSLAVLAMLVTSKVFSAQYMLWGVPLALLCAVELAGSATALWTIAGACLVTASLTTVFYPLGTRYVESLPAWLMTVLAARNVVFAAMVVWLIAAAARRDRLPPSADRMLQPR